MRAVLVFCEGHDDVVFVQRSLGAISQCCWYDGSIVDLPTPFGGSGSSARGYVARHFIRSVDKLGPGPEKLPPPYRFPAPHFHSVVYDADEETWFFLVTMGGVDKSDLVFKMIDEVFAAVNSDDVDISTFASAIVCDANDIGVNMRLRELRVNCGACFGDYPQLLHARWADTQMCPIGAFVFHNPDYGFGTLETHVKDMVASVWPERYESACKFIESTSKNCDVVSKRDSYRLKAVITSVGQFDFPGASLSRVIDRDGIPREEFRNMAVCTELVQFLQDVPWDKIPSLPTKFSLP